MTRTHVRFGCEACGFESPKWLGRCPDCGEWGSFGQQTTVGGVSVGAISPPVPLADVDISGVPRLATTVTEVDRVLDGGLVAGSVTLIGGEPGMGKSTLVLQALGAIAATGRRCLLVSAEESLAQVRMRADRLGTLAPDLLIVNETSLPAVCAHVDELRPAVVAIDSIQTVHDPDAPGAPGSVAQVRDAAHRLVRLAKETGTATLLVGHVTKDGALAGPRLLEHVVDTVLSFEGDRHHALRLLRALKHRFGATDELGLMEMTSAGLEAVADPSALFLGDRRPGGTGSVVAPILEGARPLCVEVQALVMDSQAPVPRRIAQALDGNRLALLLAVLERRARVEFGRAEVYTSIAGGVRVVDPGADLALLLALASAKADRAVPADTVALGEVGLGGEVRQAAQAPRRLAEVLRLGFRRAIVPASTPDVRGLELVRVAGVRDAMGAVGLA
ncbi:MAG: DNA repair protein RadA [Acidimicrobiia bacterium]